MVLFACKLIAAAGSRWQFFLFQPLLVPLDHEVFRTVTLGELWGSGHSVQRSHRCSATTFELAFKDMTEPTLWWIPIFLHLEENPFHLQSTWSTQEKAEIRHGPVPACHHSFSRDYAGISPGVLAQSGATSQPPRYPRPQAALTASGQPLAASRGWELGTG